MKNNNIDNGKAFDWGNASYDYAKYRDIYPDVFYQSIADLGLCVKGQKVLDLGTGTGVLPRNMAKYGARFVGADISENQIKYARMLTKEAGLNIDYVVASSENFEFDNKTFDIVTACQCFMYFDKSIALKKIHDVLKEDGHFLILFMAWLPFESEIARKSEELVLKYNPSWTGAGMKRYDINNPQWLGNLFEVANAITYDVDIPFTRESWNGRMKACRGIDASLSIEQIKDWEKEHLEYLTTQDEKFSIKHYVSILDLKSVRDRTGQT